MKIIFRLGSRGLILTAACIGLAAEEAVETQAPVFPSSAAKTAMHIQLASLVREDAGVFIAPGEREENDGGTAALSADTLRLEPMTVKGERIVIPPPLHESPIQEFLRTGTLWEKVGPRFTQRLWVRGDRGIMFTILW